MLTTITNALIAEQNLYLGLVQARDQNLVLPSGRTITQVLKRLEDDAATRQMAPRCPVYRLSRAIEPCNSLALYHSQDRSEVAVADTQKSKVFHVQIPLADLAGLEQHRWARHIQLFLSRLAALYPRVGHILDVVPETVVGIDVAERAFVTQAEFRVTDDISCLFVDEDEAVNPFFGRIQQFLFVALPHMVNISVCRAAVRHSIYLHKTDLHWNREVTHLPFLTRSSALLIFFSLSYLIFQVELDHRLDTEGVAGVFNIFKACLLTSPGPSLRTLVPLPLAFVLWHNFPRANDPHARLPLVTAGWSDSDALVPLARIADRVQVGPRLKFPRKRFPVVSLPFSIYE
jgi:hypothetical protein